MKQNYTRDTDEVYFNRWLGYECANHVRWCYSHKFVNYCRYPRTFSELRQNNHADNEGLPVRRRRVKVPTCYDDLRVGRSYGKSWKDYTKRRKQWEVR